MPPCNDRKPPEPSPAAPAALVSSSIPTRPCGLAPNAAAGSAGIPAGLAVVAPSAGLVSSAAVVGVLARRRGRAVGGRERSRATTDQLRLNMRIPGSRQPRPEVGGSAPTEPGPEPRRGLWAWFTGRGLSVPVTLVEVIVSPTASACMAGVCFRAADICPAMLCPAFRHPGPTAPAHALVPVMLWAVSRHPVPAVSAYALLPVMEAKQATQSHCHGSFP